MFCSRSGVLVCDNLYAALLSSNMRQVTLGVLVCTLKPFSFSYSSKLTISITSCSAVDSAMYLALVVMSAITYYILIASISVNRRTLSCIRYANVLITDRLIIGAAMIQPSPRQHSILTLFFVLP